MALSLLAKVGLGIVGGSILLNRSSMAVTSPAGVGTVTNPAAQVTNNTIASLLASVLKGQQTQQQQGKSGGGGGMPSTAMGGGAKPSGGVVGADPWSQYVQDPGNVREPTPLPPDLSKLPQLDAPALPNDGSIAPAGQGSLQAMLDNISAGNPILGAPDNAALQAADAANGIGMADPFGGGGGSDPFADAVVPPEPDLNGLLDTGGDPWAGADLGSMLDMSALLDPTVTDPSSDYAGGGDWGGYW